MAIKVIIQRREVKLGKKSGIKFVMRPNIHKEKGTDIGDVGPFYVAEREGFEPPVPLGTVVFKTTVIDHSTISPVLRFLESGCKGSKNCSEFIVHSPEIYPN